ncbi:MAG: hypothetical protein QOJ29_418 [Thermoleophilaceae bacterium]|jgi:hypothetical protein|nr:hypothetical protein [Thermoleophilaceae bacterium]
MHAHDHDVPESVTPAPDAVVQAARFTSLQAAYGNDRAGLLRLQQTVGNRAVGRLIARQPDPASSRRLARIVKGDVLAMEIEPSFATALDDKELKQQLAKLRDALARADDPTLRQNLTVLENEAVRRNPHGSSPLPAHAPAPATPPQPATPRAPQPPAPLPPVSPTDMRLYVPPGIVWQQYSAAVTDALDDRNPTGARIALGVLAVLAAPLAGVEEYIGRPIVNIPFTMSNAGTHLGEHGAKSVLEAQRGETAEATLDALEAVQAFSEGFTAPAPVAIPIAGAIESRAVGPRVTLATGDGAGSGALREVREIKKGEKVKDLVDEIKDLVYTTGNEHGVVSYPDGRRMIVSGGPTGISFDPTKVRRVIGHVHPPKAILPPEIQPTPGPSGGDIHTLTVLGQRSSWLVDNGEFYRFWVPSGRQGNPIRLK